MSIVNTPRQADLAPADSEARTSRWAALTGAGFVACALAGNGLAGSVDLTDAARPVSAQVGLGLEVFGTGLLILFVGWLCAVARPGLARTVAGAAGAVMVAVKLGAGAPLLAAWHEEGMGRSNVEALVAVNDAAFVLSWVPFGLLVVAAAVVLAARGLVGRGMRITGLGLGCLTAVLGAVGSVAPAAVVPIPFLPALVWLGAVSVLATAGLRHAGE